VSLQTILQELYEQRGKLTASIVLEEARDPGHPLHSRFEWNDSVAAEKYRLEQARELIRKVKIIYKEATERDGPKSVRAYYSVPGPEGRSFRSSEEVANNPLMLKLVLAEMERDWKLIKQRYGHLVEFSQMVQRDLEQAA